MDNNYKIEFQIPGLMNATLSNVIVTVMSGGEPGMALLDNLDRIATRFRKEFPAGWAALTLVGKVPGLPDEAFRKRSAALMKRDESMLVAQAMVVEGQGFFASAVRAAMTGIQMLSRTAHPNVVVATVEEAAAFTAPLLGKHPGVPTSAELAQVLVELRGMVDPRKAVRAPGEINAPPM